jgi:hypothetical protein
MVYIGMATGDVRYLSGAFTSTDAPPATQATKKPFPNNVVGTNALVLVNLAGNIIAAEGGTNGGIYRSTDAGVTYNGTSLISFSSLTYQSLNVIDANTWYLMTQDGNHYMLMNTSNVGASWQVIFNYDASTTTAPIRPFISRRRTIESGGRSTRVSPSPFRPLLVQSHPPLLPLRRKMAAPITSLTQPIMPFTSPAGLLLLHHIRAPAILLRCWLHPMAILSPARMLATSLSR